MADINVERKGPSIWPWIIGLIVLALIIWALTQMFRGDDTTRTAPATTPADTPAAVGTQPGVRPDTPMTGVGAPGTTGPGGTPGTQQPPRP